LQIDSQKTEIDAMSLLPWESANMGNALIETAAIKLERSPMEPCK
jgi:hypothetical protein